MLPIYDSLVKKLPKTPLDLNARNNFLLAVAKCSQEEMEIIFGIILSYCLAEKIPLTYYPFNSRVVGDGVHFDFIDLPQKLQNILNKFVLKFCCLINKEDVNWFN